MLILLLLLFLFFLGVATSYKFVLVPKTTDNPFFQLSRDGCVDRSTELHNSCGYGGVAATEDNQNPDPDGVLQVEYVQQLLLQTEDSLDGLAISVKNADLMTPVIDLAVTQFRIPVVTFDSDAPDSKRSTYIGTDNHFLGKTLAKTAKQITPEGGTYVILLSDESPNILARDEGFRLEMTRPESLWTELSGSPAVYERDLDVALSHMDAFAVRNPTVLMTAVGGPLFADGYADFYKRHRPRNITIVSADDFDVQITHLSRGYVQGLVGQMPYEMGYLAAQVLHDLLMNNNNSSSIPVPQVLGTNLITHIQVPLVLPELHVDNNLIGQRGIVGYILFGIIAATSLLCGVWTFCRKRQTVVQAAQPVFLILVALGVLILGATIVPLSMDDGGQPISETKGTWICMSVPWLGCCGFTITFSALFSKMIRINRILQETRECRRVKVTATDVLAPFAILLTLNVLILLLWSFLDPLTYVRIDHPGTDGWNRIISTYGACRSDNAWPYLASLAAINLGVLAMANWQAYKARKVKSEFAESKYIWMAMVALLQALLIGLPIVFVVRDSPQAFHLTLSFMMFVICMVLLLLIFVPKMVMADVYSHRSQAEQRRMIRNRIQESVPSSASLLTRTSILAVQRGSTASSLRRPSSEEEEEEEEQQQRRRPSSGYSDHHHDGGGVGTSQEISMTAAAAADKITSNDNGG